MKLPFTAEQFFAVFSAYNVSVWPAQALLLALALIAVALVAVPSRGADAMVSAILALLWIWLGLAYHLAFFAGINPLAYAFAALSVAGGLVLLWHGVIRQRLHFRLARSARGLMGVALVLYALVVYPAWSIHAGHRYPALPTFGLPCPTTLYTLGVLAFLVRPYPRAPLIVPILWCLVGAQAAFLLGVPQDLGLIAAALVGVVLLVGNSPPATSPGARAGS